MIAPCTLQSPYPCIPTTSNFINRKWERFGDKVFTTGGRLTTFRDSKKFWKVRVGNNFHTEFWGLPGNSFTKSSKLGFLCKIYLHIFFRHSGKDTQYAFRTVFILFIAEVLSPHSTETRRHWLGRDLARIFYCTVTALKVTETH